MPGIKKLLKVVGSLWFAAALLLILMLAMGSATIFETTHGTEQTQALFYHSSWFKGLLALFTLNVLAALLLRWPYNRSLIPFVMAHVGLITILTGALCTDKFGVDGRIVLLEGETGNQFLTSMDTLTLAPKGKENGSVLNIEDHVGSVYSPKDLNIPKKLKIDDVVVRPIRYMPDQVWEKKITDDNTTPNLALEVSLTGKKGTNTAWIMSGTSKVLGGTFATVKEFKDPADMDKIITAIKDRNKKSEITIVIDKESFSFPISSCLSKEIGVGTTGFMVKALRYLPHAVMDENNKALNASQKPVNPAVEVNLSGNGKQEVRLVFAKFPDLQPTLSGTRIETMNATFTVGDTDKAPSARAPIEIMVTDGQAMAVRFAWEGTKESVEVITPGTPIETPFPGKSLTLLKRYNNAQVRTIPIMPKTIRKNSQPALEVEIIHPESSQKMWLRKYHSLSINGKAGAYVLSYQDKPNKLDFNIKLNSFHVGYYPGGMRPRTFESNVVFEDPETGAAETKLISMNHPGKYKGYTFYQSSYNQSKTGTSSILSVSKDPGLPIVYLGYFLTVFGMLAQIILKTVRERKHLSSDNTNEAEAV